MGKGHPGGKLKGSSHVMHNKNEFENSFAGAAVFCVLWGQHTNLLTLIFSNLAARLSTHSSPYVLFP